MGQAPLDRDEQIKFMKNADARRKAAIERWSMSEMHEAALSEPSRADVHDSEYSRKNVVGRLCA